MYSVFVVVTVLAAVANAAAAAADFLRAEWIVGNMTKYGVPHSWLFPLGVLKSAGALGLLVGIGVPPLGIAASVGLGLYFLGAVVTVVRARWYSHVAYPGAFLLLAVGMLVVQIASS